MNTFVNHILLPSNRRILACLAVLATAGMPTCLSAQETVPAVTAPEAVPEVIPPEVPADMGFLRLVNAVGLPGVLRVRIDGIEVGRRGYKEGEATGSVGLEPKSYQVELTHEALGKETVQVPVQTGQIITVIAFKTEKPDQDPKTRKALKDKPEKTAPRLASHLDLEPVSPPDLKASVLTLLQLTSSEEIIFTMSGTSVPANSGKPVRIPITGAMGRFPDVHLQGKPVCLLNFDSPAEQFVVLFTGEDGSLKNAQMRNDGQ